MQFQPSEENLSLNRRALEEIDLLLLMIETLDVNATNLMLSISKELKIDNLISNEVELWKIRSHNPLRKISRRGSLSKKKIDSIIYLISISADRLYPIIRKYLSSKESDKENSLRWNLLSIKFNELLTERMNIRRGAIQNLLLNPDKVMESRNLLLKLALSSGVGGYSRLKASLCDYN